MPESSQEKPAPEEADQLPEVLPADPETTRSAAERSQPWVPRSRDRERRDHVARPQITCPYCKGPITAPDLECQHCQASLKDADLLEEETCLSQQLQRRRRWAFVFGVPGVIFLFATVVVLVLIREGQLEAFWAIPPLALMFLFILIGLVIEATAWRGSYGETFTIYRLAGGPLGGLAALVARFAFGETIEKSSRIRAVLQERGVLIQKKQRGPGARLTFAALNFCLAGVAIAGIVSLAWGLAHRAEIVPERRGQGSFALVAIAYLIIGVILCSLAGAGLLRKRMWGYVLHLVAACWAALSCIGIIYTIPVLFLSLFYPPLVSAVERRS